jgi:hypothetical protein
VLFGRLKEVEPIYPGSTFQLGQSVIISDRVLHRHPIAKVAPVYFAASVESQNL